MSLIRVLHAEAETGASQPKLGLKKIAWNHPTPIQFPTNMLNIKGGQNTPAVCIKKVMPVVSNARIAG